MSGRKKTIADLAEAEIRGRRVLVRVDYNVPLDDDGRITDDTRITTTLPTLDALLQQGARVILLSHFGRPKGKPVPEMSLKPVADRLRELLEGRRVEFVADTVGHEARTAIGTMFDGDVLLLENTRFHPGEEENDSGLAEEIAGLGDVFVNDAMRAASEGRMKGILGYEETELVSIDFTGNPHSSIVDAPSTSVLDGLVKVIAWYDNEWGYSCRCVDLARFMGEKL